MSSVGQREAKPIEASKQMDCNEQCSSNCRILTTFRAEFWVSIACVRTLFRWPECHETNLMRKSVSWMTCSHLIHIIYMKDEHFTWTVGLLQDSLTIILILYVQTTFVKLLKPLIFGHYGNPSGELMNFLLDQVSTPRVHEKISEVDHITHDGEIRRYLKRSYDARQNQTIAYMRVANTPAKKLCYPKLQSDQVICTLWIKGLLPKISLNAYCNFHSEKHLFVGVTLKWGKGQE